jgi:hypothetical protein
MLKEIKTPMPLLAPKFNACTIQWFIYRPQLDSDSGNKKPHLFSKMGFHIDTSCLAPYGKGEKAGLLVIGKGGAA